MILETWIQILVTHPNWDRTKGHNNSTQDVAIVIMVTFSIHSSKGKKALWLEIWDRQLIMPWSQEFKFSQS